MTTAMKEQFCRDVIISGPILDEMLDWIEANLGPQDVFTEEQLDKWAENHGWRQH